MTKDNGGPAFPIQLLEDETYQGQGSRDGMTMRDYFAGQALSSMLSTPSEIRDTTYDKAAELSYKFADAMLAERGKS